MNPAQQLALILAASVVCALIIWALGFELLCNWIARLTAVYRIRRAQRLIVQVGGERKER